MHENRSPRVIFYTNTPRAFETTLIGTLYEISQEFSVTLLSEEMNDEVNGILKDKKLFPNLNKVIPVHQHTGPKMSLIRKQQYLSNLAKEVISEHPDIVIASSDWHSVFEMYLMRFAKEIGVLRVTVQDTFSGETKKMGKWVDMFKLYQRTPTWFPYWFRQFIIQFKKYLTYFVYHILLPITVGQKPFLTTYSYALFKGASGCGDSLYQIVLSEKDFMTYKINGVPESKLRVLAHPINRHAKVVFDRMVASSVNVNIDVDKNKIMVVLLPAEEIGIHRQNYGLITKSERLQMYMRVFEIITNILPDYFVVVKPHPVIKDMERRKKYFSQVSEKIVICNPSEPATKWIKMADIIMELPRAMGTTLISATLQCPEKPILALDFQSDFLGDAYKNYEGIEYLESEEEFIHLLEEIRDGTYVKNNYLLDNDGSSQHNSFASLLKELYENHSSAIL